MRFVPHLHKSTCVVLLLTAIALFFAIVPGSDRLVLVPAECRLSRWVVGDGFARVHGWPWVYLGRDWFPLQQARSGSHFLAGSPHPPISEESPWALQHEVRWFHLGCLLADLFVAAVILVGVGAAFEIRRHRHPRLMRLSLRELMLLVLLVALGTWWGTLEWRAAHQRAEFLARVSVHATTGSAVPLWWRHWFGEPSTPLLTQVYHAELFGSTEEINAALADIDRVPEIRVVDITVTKSEPDSAPLDLTPLQKLDRLQVIDVGTVTDGCVVVGDLSDVTRLVSLNLSTSAFDPRLIESIRGCANLEVLSFSGAGHGVTSAPYVNYRCLESSPCSRNLKLLHIASTSACDEDLAWLATAPRLQELSLSGKSIGDATLAKIGTLADLEHLDVVNSQITDAGLQSLAGLTRLSSLHIDGTQITDVGLAHLARHENLVSLGLNGTRISTHGLVHLAGLTNLQRLDLGDVSGQPIDDAGVRHLDRLRNLSYLSLSGSKVTDDSLQFVTRFTHLHQLNLSRCLLIDEAGIVALSALKDLYVLHLSSRATSPAVERRLKSDLPYLTIQHWP